jgi:hypothetical protein
MVDSIVGLGCGSKERNPEIEARSYRAGPSFVVTSETKLFQII